MGLAERLFAHGIARLYHRAALTCPDANTLAGFAERRCSPAEEASLEAHVDSCATCFQVVAQLLSAGGVEDGSLPALQSDGAAGLEGLHQPGGKVGRYLLVDWLGMGGMGVVFRAYDPELQRDVALKLVRTSGGSSGGEEQRRLLEEAQTLARITHPNVVRVYDVGTFEDRVFVAMELIEGVTLAQWLAESERPLREVQSILLQAAEALAAAHRAGVIHRDFKPQNALVRHDTLTVVDFGLARLERGARRRSSGPAARTLANVGTPAYMAPEQHRGEPADARSDQFSFSLVAWEALFRRRPAVSGDAVVLPESGRGTARLQRALARGLSWDPAARFPSMAELLSEWRAAARPRWRWAAAAALLAVGLVGAAVAIVHEDPNQRCAAGASRAEGLEAAAAGLPSHLAWPEVRAGLERYAREWRAAYVDACSATFARGAQSPASLERRAACLDQRLAEATALTALLRSAAPERALSAVDALPLVSRCAVADRLPPSASAPDATRRRSALAKVRALDALGQYGDALREVEALQRDTVKAHDASLEPEVQLAFGRALLALGRLEEADAHLGDAGQRADALGLDVLRAEALVSRVMLMGREKARFEEGERLAASARAVLQRLGGERALEASLTSAVGSMKMMQGQFKEAELLLRQVVELRERLPGSTASLLAPSLVRLGNALAEQGRTEEALAQYRRAEQLFGPSPGPHPTVAVALGSQGIALWLAGRLKEARGLLERALELQLRALGADHPDVGTTHQNLGNLLSNLDEMKAALRHYREAIRITAKVRGDGHPDLGRAYQAMSLVLMDVDDLEGAEAALREAERIQTALPPGHPDHALRLASLAQLAAARGQPSVAVRHAEAALKLSAGPETPPRTRQFALSVAGRIFAAVQPRAAVEHLEAVLKERGEADAQSSFTDLRYLARAQAALHRPEAARGSLQRAQGLIASHPEARRARAARELAQSRAELSL